jgi:hypothetical protein
LRAVNLIFAQFAAPAIEGESNNNYLINSQNKLLFSWAKAYDDSKNKK